VFANDSPKGSRLSGHVPTHIGMKRSVTYLVLTGIFVSLFSVFQNCSVPPLASAPGASSGVSNVMKDGGKAQMLARDGQGSKANLDFFWAKEAHFVPFRRLKFPPEVNADHFMSSRIVARNGIWYSLTRRTYKNTRPGCWGDSMDLLLHSSRDQGATWSASVLVDRSSDKFCMITDASLFFDVDMNKMFILTQCLTAQTNSWDLCLYTGSGLDPMTATWTPASQNPVIRSGDLWRQICAKSGRCESDVGEEGTPEIIAKRSGWYYITFHGFKNPKGYRGIARTRDFITYDVNGADMADGPLFTVDDCSRSVSGCVGPGHGSMTFTNEFAYTLFEVPTQNLACERGQRWPFVLARTSNFWSKSPTWDVFDQRPILENNMDDGQGCQLQYANLFVDRGITYLAITYHSRRSDEWFPGAVFQLTLNGAPIEDTRDRRDILNNFVIYPAREINFVSPAPPQVMPVIPSPPGPQLPPSPPTQPPAPTPIPVAPIQPSPPPAPVLPPPPVLTPVGPTQPIPVVPAPTPVAPAPVAPVQTEFIDRPLVTYITEPVTPNRHVWPASAWMAFSSRFGDIYCNAYRSGWRVDMDQSVSSYGQVFICNVNLEITGAGVSGLGCAEGISGSLHFGTFFGRIACRGN
jgi:hypothetical protein